MRAWMVCGSLVLVVAGVGVASAAPRAGGRPAAPVRVNAGAKYKEAVAEHASGNYARALELIAQGLAAQPRRLELLRLRCEELLESRDYPRALEAYDAYLAAGPTGAAAREAKKIAEKLRVVKATFLEVTVANGPADVYLNTKTQGVFCRAAPACKQPVLPDRYKIIVERPGFKPWSSDNLEVPAGQTTPVAATLLERPSLLTVRAEPAGARVTVDDAPLAEPAEVAPGKHQVTASLAGYTEERRDIEAREGAPIELAIELAAPVRVRVQPPGAELLLDGQRLAIEGGRAAIPRGAHALVARAAGYRERRIEIPAERAAGYELAIELDPDRASAVESERAPAPGRFTLRRKLALVAGGVSLAAAGTGVALGLKASSLEDDGRSRDADRRTLQSQLAYAGAGVAVLIAVGLWLDGEPEPPHVALTPRPGGAAIDFAVRF